MPTSTSVGIALSPRERCGSWCSAMSTCVRAYTSIETAWPALKTDGSQPPSRASSLSCARRQTATSAKRRMKSAHPIQKTPSSSFSSPSS